MPISSRSTRGWPGPVERQCRRVRKGYSISLAPLVVKDKVIIGVGGESTGPRIHRGVRRRERTRGLRSTRFPAPGDRASEKWSGDAGRTGGGSIWVTRSYDPVLNLTYWGVGKPGPDFNAAQRAG